MYRVGGVGKEIKIPKFDISVTGQQYEEDRVWGKTRRPGAVPVAEVQRAGGETWSDRVWRPRSCGLGEVLSEGLRDQHRSSREPREQQHEGGGKDLAEGGE